MIVAPLRRAATLIPVLASGRSSFCTSIPRTSGGSNWKYRTAPNPAPRSSVIIAECLGGFAWWWVLWHLWTEPEHIFGAFDVPDPLLWTDEELGIPPDDED